MIITRLGPRKAPLRVTPEIVAVRRVVRLLNAREARGEVYKETKRRLRELLLKLLEEANR